MSNVKSEIMYTANLLKVLRQRVDSVETKSILKQSTVILLKLTTHCRRGGSGGFYRILIDILSVF